LMKRYFCVRNCAKGQMLDGLKGKGFSKRQKKGLDQPGEKGKVNGRGCGRTGGNMGSALMGQKKGREWELDGVQFRLLYLNLGRHPAGADDVLSF